jgi:sugar phosphate isomerase/epimerase
MSIVISDWGKVEQAAPLARKFGVGLEVAEFTIPENTDRVSALAPSIKENLAGIQLVTLHAPFAEMVPATRDPLVRQVVRTRLQQGYDVALELGAQHVVMHSGFIPKTYPRQAWLQNSLAFWVEFLADKPRPNLIHMENVYEDDYSTLQELVDGVNQQLGAERLTVCLDIGHVNANSSRALAQWIIALGDRIRYTHLHNNAGVLDDHWGLGKGAIDMPAVLELLRAHAPNAVWTIETVIEDTESSLEWLRAAGYL